MTWKKLCTRFFPNNSQISTDLVSSTSGTESAKNYTNYRKKIFKVVYTYFQLILNFLEWDTEKMLGIKSEAIHSLTEKRVPKLTYYHSSNSGVPTSTTEQQPSCWKSPGPTKPWRFIRCLSGIISVAECKYLRTLFSLGKKKSVISVWSPYYKEGMNQQRGKSPTILIKRKEKELIKLILEKAQLNRFSLNHIVYKCHHM